MKCSHPLVWDDSFCEGHSMVNRVMVTGHSMWWKTRGRFKPGFPSMLPKGRPPLRTELMPFLVVFIQIDMAPVNHGSISVSQPLSPCSPSTHHQHENHHWCPRCHRATKQTHKKKITEHTHKHTHTHTHTQTNKQTFTPKLHAQVECNAKFSSMSEKSFYTWINYLGCTCTTGMLNLHFTNLI